VTPHELALVLASALLHAWWSFAIKGSRDPLAFNLLQLAAPFGILLAVAPFVVWSEIPARVWWLVAGTALFHGLYFYWMTRAFEHGDLTLVYPIARSTPAFIPLVAAPLLGERISPAAALGIAIVVAGIWLVGAGGGVTRSALRGAAARYAFLTLAAGVGYSLVDKAAMARFGAAPWSSPVPRAYLYAVLLGISGTFVFAPLAWLRTGPGLLERLRHGQLGRATFASVVSYAGYALVLAAMQTAPVSYVVAGRQTSVLFALVMGVLWLGETPGRPRMWGAAATVLGVALIAFAG
jgi:drug/metabolite transporter (DMT)-like permease